MEARGEALCTAIAQTKVGDKRLTFYKGITNTLELFNFSKDESVLSLAYRL